VWNERINSKVAVDTSYAFVKVYSAFVTIWHCSQWNIVK